MTAPSEEQVRDLLTADAELHENIASEYSKLFDGDGCDGDDTSARHREIAAKFRAALALLDAGRKDRERVAVLLAVAEWQIRGDVHELTCGNNSRHRPLVPTLDGLRCLDCDWTQDVPAWFAAIDRARGA